MPSFDHVPVAQRMVQAALIAVAFLMLLGRSATAAPVLPEIRINVANPVPACVTPDRLMSFLRSRNASVSPRFRDIAFHYKKHGDAWRVRWDYAFFQMAIETNFLTYRRPDGRMGDVDPTQNNFAGIGTTGGGVPGDRFPDVSTGVLAQIQHLVVYSGEYVVQPVAPRTRLKQDHILVKSRELMRPVRFSDLARRWAADPKYASAIEWVAQSYRDQYCRGMQRAMPQPVAPRHPIQPPQQQPVEVLPWLNKPLAPRADGAHLFTTGSIEGTASEQPQPSAVRTVWSREAESQKKKKTPPLSDVLAKTVVSASEGDAPLPPAPQPARASDIKALPSRAAAVEPVVASPAVEPGESREFALFSPPAWLAANGASRVATAEAFERPSGLGMKTIAAPEALKPCRIEKATFGGNRAVLVRAPEADVMRFVALSVLPGFEKSMTESFIATRAIGGTAVGEFESQDQALARAKELCPKGM